MEEKQNHLKDEHSPYLLQHAKNPVDWYPWSEEALSKAKQEDKLLIISIGYAACHWCHVMEHECFEDEEVAELMNRHFVSVKVDREERPDIDQVYMDAAYVITGRGGWPLNVIALADGTPVYAGTYFPKREWIYVLSTIAEAHQNNRSGLEQDASLVSREMRKAAIIQEGMDSDLPGPDEIMGNWAKVLDMNNGGTRGAPKFPMPVNISCLLKLGVHLKNKHILESVELTLDRMAAGGIFDHIGGGFCRYSTDAKWHVPHFEKMLYDNAQLVSLYSTAFKHFRKPRYKEIVYDTLEFISRELTSPEGLFYSSIDADSEGREGAFYTWKTEEIEAILGEKAELFNEYFGVTRQGNWEKGENVLFRQVTDEKQVQVIRDLTKQVFREREKRPRPLLDYKLLASWNAMMISAYVTAGFAFADPDLAEKAVAAGLETERFLKEDGSVLHAGGHGFREITGFLEDYALLAAAYTDLYQQTFDLKCLNKADALVDYAVKHFSHENEILFYFTEEGKDNLIIRKTETGDNVIPSSNSVMAHNLMTLGHLLSNNEYLERSEKMVKAMSEQIRQAPYHHALWVSVMQDHIHPPEEISITGPDWKTIHQEMLSFYLPGAIYSGGESESNLEILRGKVVQGKTQIYVCRDRTCSAPVETVKEAMDIISGHL